MITVDQIQFERYFAPVFEPVSFHVGPGELLLVTGANGSGKTTLIRLLAGLLHPASGRINATTRDLALVGHQLAIKEDLTVMENLRFAARFNGGGCSPEEAVGRLGLTTVRWQEARTLSAGQRKRCALARLLLGTARLWLLDEPYSNLDTEGMAVMDGLLRDHVGSGGACIMSTHGQLRPQGVDYDVCDLRIPGGSA